MERASPRSRVRRLEADGAATPLAELAGAAAPRAFWDDGRPVVCSGAAFEVVAEGPDRFRAAREAAQDLFGRLEVERDPAAPEAVGPRFVGGFGFEDRAAGPPWQDFPALRFWLPRRQLHWTDDGVFEVVNEVPGAASVPVPRPEPGPAGDLDGAAWDDAVRRVLDAVAEGHVSKVVLSRRRRAPPADALEALAALRAVEPEATHFLLGLGASALYGATPERLAVREDGLVRTHALAGSAPPGEAEGRALLASPKDVLEHELVTTYIRGRLEALGAGDVHQERRRLQRLAHVQHLETPIEARTDRHVLDVAAALHPTPAVCGLPPRASLALMRELEPTRRGWYTGGVGWFDARGEGRLCVALRCALSTPDATWLHAGAGIVADSDPRREYEETEHKLRSLESALERVRA